MVPARAAIMVGVMQLVQSVRGHAADRKDVIPELSFMDRWTSWIRDAITRLHRSSSTLTLLLVGFMTMLLYFGAFRRRRTTPPSAEIPTPTSATATEENKSSTASSRRPTDVSPALHVPAHVAVQAAVVSENGSNLLHDGLVAFRFTTAAAPLPQDERLRRDRAQLLARLLWSDPQHKPPKKGSTLVISIPMDSVDCSHQRYGLYLLASYYNLFVLLVQSAAEPQKLLEQRRAEAIDILRGDTKHDAPQEQSAECCFLAPSVLPTHRILSSITVSGRVAISRQLQSVDVILDYEAEVQSLLSRFGHVVILYNHSHRDAASSNNTVRSEFGKLLL